MKYTTAMLAASAVATNAQFTINPNGSITCAASNPNGAFCASDSLGSPIIIRCTDGVGEAGNCSDNLAGEPPFDVFFGECYQTSPTAGDAACSKNCVVYPPGGTPFTLPASLCTPSETTSSSVTSSATSSVPTITSNTSSAPTSSITVTSTGTSVYTSAGTTITDTFTTTYCPASTLSTAVIPTGTSVISPPGTNGTTGGNGSGSGSGSGSSTKNGGSPTGSGNGGSNNGTAISTPAGNGEAAGSSPTATPVGPTTTGTVPFTGGAITNSAPAALAMAGLAVAYFL